MYAPPVQRLITELSKLPGVGGRTAQRLAFHLLRASDEDAMSLAEAIREVKERIGFCEVCFNLADGPRCRICADERREEDVICVVEDGESDAEGGAVNCKSGVGIAPSVQ